MDYLNFNRTHGHLPMQKINTSSIAHAHETARIQSVPKFHGMDEEDMNFQLHRVEKAAYRAVLMAFSAQSDVISWGKEGLITELRKELNVTDTEHRELLVQIDSDESVRKIRNWRKYSSNVQESHSAGMNVPGFYYNLEGNTLHKKLKKSQAAVPTSHKFASHDERYSEAILTSQKYSPHGQPYSAPAPTSQKYALHGEPYSAPVLTTHKYASHGEHYSAPVLTSQKYAAHGEPYTSGVLTSQNASHGKPYSAAIPSQLPAERRVDQRSGKFVLLSMGKAGNSISNVQASSLSKGRQAVISHLNDYHTPDDGSFSERSGLIQIRETNKLLCEVERMVYGREHPDPVLVEKAKLVLKEHERSLLDVLATLSNVSDGDKAPNQMRHHYSSEMLQGTW